MNERRRLPRYPFEGRATVVFRGLYRNVRVVDLSLAGALVEPVATGDLTGFTAGARCEIRLSLPAGDEELGMKAVVVRSGAGRAALVLFGMRLRPQRILHRLIQMNFCTARIPQRGLCGPRLPAPCAASES
jgi:hypothetical protein